MKKVQKHAARPALSAILYAALVQASNILMTKRREISSYENLRTFASLKIRNSMFTQVHHHLHPCTQAS